MKRKFLFLMLGWLAVLAMQAKSITKSVVLNFSNDSKNGITWSAGTNTVDGKKITFSGDWSTSSWTFAKPVHIVSFSLGSVEKNTELTFKFVDTKGKTYYCPFFGKDNIESSDFDLTKTNENEGDLTQITSIGIDPRVFDANDGATATFSTINVTYEESGYDEVLTTPATDASLFPMTVEGINTTIWGDTNAFDPSTKILTLGADGNAAGWTFDAKDLSAYNKLVIELEEPFGFEPQIRFRNATKKTVNGVETEVFNMGLPSDKTYMEVDMTASNFGYDGDNNVNKSTLYLSDINGIYFWAWAGKKEIKLKNVYLVSATGKVEYLIRNNSELNTYGTICLPFAAKVPANTAVYQIAGVDSKSNPTSLYLQKVEDNLEAGQGYVFQSTDDANITFTKEGNEDDLTSANSTSALVGTLSETTAPKDAYILVKDEWKKVAADNKNSVGAYRSWLDLNKVDEMSKQTANTRRCVLMSIGGGNGTTGITAVEAEQKNADSSCYTLDGIRTSKVTKNGIYVKNGKKVVIKK